MDVIEKPITPPSQTNTTPNLNNGVLEQNEAIKLFKQGRDAWNQWAKVNPKEHFFLENQDVDTWNRLSPYMKRVISAQAVISFAPIDCY